MPRAADILNLDPLYIPGMIEDVQTDGAIGGVNYHLLHANTAGLLVVVQAYLNMQENDWIEVFWGDDDNAVASNLVLPEDVGEDFGLFIPANRVPEGVSEVYAKVTRSGGGNGGESPPLAILVRTLFPGGTDPEPDLPGHQNLPAPEPDLPPGEIIDEDAAKNGIKVSIGAYPNMRRFDTITFSWGGILLDHEVSQAEVDAGVVEILVTEDTILAAGDSDQLVLVYKVADEVHNPSSDWSIRTYVAVEIGKGLFNAPIIENPDPEADPYDVIDLDLLGEADLVVNVYAEINGALQPGDVITVSWTGTTAQGQPITVEPAPQTVLRVPISLDFVIPNADVRQLARGRGVASYSATRDDSPAGASKRSFVTFLGEEQLLPKPTVSDAVDGVLDPGLAETTVIVPGEALEAGDTVFLTWLGKRANGTPLLMEDNRGVSGNGTGKPMSFTIAGEFIAPLDGGSVEVYYRVNKGSSGLDLQSVRVLLSVGEAQAELPAPTTIPPAEDGVLDPAGLPTTLDIVIQPWPDMQAGQIVHLLWSASSTQRYEDFMPISPAMEGRAVEFAMDRATVEEYLGSEVELSYWLEIPGAPSKRSAITRFLIAPKAVLLPLPRILEAVGSELDPDTVIDGASVRIRATARFAVGDWVTVKITSSAEDGSISIDHEILPAFAGKPATILVPHEVIEASAGGSFTLHYEVTRATGGVVEVSQGVTYKVVNQVGGGALRIMGARFNAGRRRVNGAPRVIKAYAEDSLEPAIVEWRYADDQQWTKASEWADEKPRQKLYVRSAKETWELRPENIVGNGESGLTPYDAAFAAIRDEVHGDDGPVTDLVAWGEEDNSAHMPAHVRKLTNVVSLHATCYAFAALLTDGRVACWDQEVNNIPPFMEGKYDLLRGGDSAFLGRKTNGELGVVGSTGTEIPEEARRYRDYVEFSSGVWSFAARRANGKVYAWDDPKYGGDMGEEASSIDSYLQLETTGGAFAGLYEEPNGARRVIAWGSAISGGEAPDDITRLANVKQFCAAAHSVFCIQLESGHLKTWPEWQDGGFIPKEIAALTNIVEVTSTEWAFCALLDTGRVVTWGDDHKGGKLPADLADRTTVVQVTASECAFAALLRDGTVIAWGEPSAGGEIKPGVAEQLHDVRAIYANVGAFTALTSDGRVVTWGGGGGDSSGVQHLLEGKVTHSRLLTAAEADALDAQAVAGKDR